MKVVTAVVVSILLSGCQQLMGAPPPYPEKTGDGTGPTLWLNFTLWNLAGDNRYAYLGPHCGTARSSTEWVGNPEDGWSTRDTYESVFVEEQEYAGLGAKRPFVVATAVSNDPPPGVAGTFSGFGQEGYAGGLPFQFDPQIGDDYSENRSTPLTTIDVRAGVTYIDEKPVTLPYAWDRAVPDNWSAHFELGPGPSKVELFSMEGCA